VQVDADGQAAVKIGAWVAAYADALGGDVAGVAKYEYPLYL
jgi:hypothetical protein